MDREKFLKLAAIWQDEAKQEWTRELTAHRAGEHGAANMHRGLAQGYVHCHDELTALLQRLEAPPAK